MKPNKEPQSNKNVLSYLATINKTYTFLEVIASLEVTKSRTQSLSQAFAPITNLGNKDIRQIPGESQANFKQISCKSRVNLMQISYIVSQEYHTHMRHIS